WKRIDATATASDETAAKDDTSFIVSGDATFVAEFNAIPNKYQVTFYSSATKYIWSTPVEGGATVAYGKVDKDGNAVYPTKDYDDNNHYAFSGVWYTDSTLKTAFDFTTKIYANTRLYAGYTASEHSYDEADYVVVQKATCDLPELTKKVCSCGYEITVQTEDALGHDWDDGKTVDGVTTYTCKRDASHTKTDDVQTFTVKFVNYNGLAVQSFYDIVYGQKVDFTAVEPTRADSVEATYAFIGWKDGFSDKIYSTDEIEALEITVDYTFVAEYKATTRIYRVTYVDVNNKTLQTGEFAYGAAIPAFIGTVPAKDRDDTHHYVFASWSVGTDATVAGDTVIKPVYTAIGHDYSVPVETEADCTTKGQKVLKCSGCDAVQELVTITPALGHTDVYKDADDVERKVEHTIVEPDKDNGYICTDTYTCTRCGEKIVKDVKTVELVIKVNDADKKPAAPGSATVTITNKATGKTYKTNNDENGEARFIVMANQEWTVGVTGDTLPDGGYGTTIGKGQTSLELGENTTEEDNKDDEVESGDECSCSCHKNSFWGILYRFFQNIIAKLFKGGKINCCDVPDARYKK
ncbi:MAG: hypothetical protein J6V06_02830, partial [Clostridia bacterium]|nr:hypothetical protein [Clostridia bacterium]